MFKIDPLPACTAVAAGSAPSAADGNGDADGYVHDFDSPITHGRILLDADEAMLKDFGDGVVFSSPTPSPSPSSLSSPPPLPSPLCETVAMPSAKDRPNPPADVLSPLPAVDEPSGGQFSNMDSALTMAQGLIEVYKAELARMRRISLIAWIVVAAISVVAAGVFWWGMTMSGQAGIERTNVANLTVQQATTGKALDKAAMELETIRADLRKVQADVIGLRVAIEGVRSDSSKATAEASAAHEISIKSLSAVQAFTAGIEASISRLLAVASQHQMQQGVTIVPAAHPGPMAETAPSP